MGTARGSHCLACLPSCSQAPMFLDDLPNSGSSSSRHSFVACLRVCRSSISSFPRHPFSNSELCRTSSHQHFNRISGCDGRASRLPTEVAPTTEAPTCLRERGLDDHEPRQPAGQEPQDDRRGERFRVMTPPPSLGTPASPCPLQIALDFYHRTTYITSIKYIIM